MIDWIKISAEILDWESWKSHCPSLLWTPVNLDSGEVQISKEDQQYDKVIHKCHSNGYRLKVKEVRNRLSNEDHNAFYLEVTGSLHKSYTRGENYSRFSWMQLQEEIKEIEYLFLWGTKNVRLKVLEVGVNIETPFPAFPFLKRNLICYSTHDFVMYSPKKGTSLGFFCDCNQYVVKAYDKSIHYRLSHNLMRFEIRFKRLKKLHNIGISTLSDLKHYDKVSKLGDLLLDAWNKVFLQESIDYPNLSPKYQELIRNGSRREFWQTLRIEDGNHYYYLRRVYRALNKRYGKDMHGLIESAIREEWQYLFKQC